MNRSPAYLETSATLDLDPTPRPLRLPVGAAVLAVRGTIWITQEHLHDDVILAAGERFDVKRDGLIVASAVKGTAGLHVVRTATARAHRHRDVYDFARARAKRLRHEAVGEFADFVSASVAAWFERVRNTLTVRPRAVSH